MKFKEAYNKAKFGEKLKYGNCASAHTKSSDTTALVWDNARGRLCFAEVFDRVDWYIVGEIKEVTMSELEETYGCKVKIIKD